MQPKYLHTRCIHDVKGPDTAMACGQRNKPALEACALRPRLDQRVTIGREHADTLVAFIRGNDLPTAAEGHIVGAAVIKNTRSSTLKKRSFNAE